MVVPIFIAFIGNMLVGGLSLQIIKTLYKVKNRILKTIIVFGGIFSFTILVIITLIETIMLDIKND